MSKLTARKVDTIAQPGMHGDGAGLYLRVGLTGSKSWILRTVVQGRRRDLGIGSTSLVSLAEARDAAHQFRKIARAGGDPDAVRRRESMTFEDAAKRVHKNLLPTWRSQRHGEIWLSALERFAYPHIGKRPLETIGAADLLKVLEPIWATKFDTANRVKQRIAAIFDWAKGAGHYPHENPVNGLKKALPNVRPMRTHMAALPWRDLPTFCVALSTRDGLSARALEFAILTAARSGDVRGAKWDEIAGDIWTIPGVRMKSGQSHRVPLSAEAMAVLVRVRGLDSELVFPSARRSSDGKSRMLSDTVFKALMDRMGRPGLTTHGFRSTFRDWCGDSAHANREVAEAALSHALGNKVEQADARSDLFDRRRALMEKWAEYATGKAGKVVRLVSR